MSTDLALKEQYQDAPLIDIGIRESFIKRLDEQPKNVDKAQGFDTLPISHLEHELDEIYMGAWTTENFRWQVVANEIIGTIDLKVFDPTLKTWLKRSGSAAVMIQQKSGSEITDLNAKFKNALVKDFAKLETMCLKKAAKSLGKRFGRDLNRKIEDTYEELYSNEMLVNENLEAFTAALNKCNDLPSLKAFWNDNPDFHENTAAKKLFTKRKMQLVNG